MHPPEIGHFNLSLEFVDRSVLQSYSSIPLVIVLLALLAVSFHPTVLSSVKQKIDVVSVATVLLSCGAYMVVGPLLMVLNKEILDTLHFNFPVTLAGLGVFTTAVVVRCMVLCGFSEVRSEATKALEGHIWHKTVLPIAAAKAATLALGNTIYLYLGLGFIQMLKAFNPVIVVVVMRVSGLPLPPRLARWGVYLIIAGTLLEVKGELHATCLGIFLMIMGEIFEAIHLVLTQKLLQNCKLTLIEGLYMITPPSSLMLLLGASIFEWPRMIQEGSHRMIFQQPWYFLGTCFLGLLVNFVGMAVIQATSSLTVKVLNTARGIGVVAVGILFYGEYCASLELCGYSFALVGLALYNYAQMTNVSDGDRHQ
mmetsp:Transcript_83291/g.130005  ORF Transcript_83291/g.130005 Transcript_83291/m.130005 type:complete len:367 (-) Transcript_83291:108-1208(-)